MIKREIKFEDYKKYLEQNKIIWKEELKLRSKLHKVCTEKINKIDLKKRIQTKGGIKHMHIELYENI